MGALFNLYALRHWGDGNYLEISGDSTEFTFK